MAGIYREDKAKCPAWAVYLGNISYGLFVFHSLAIHIARSFTVEYFPLPTNFAAKVGLVSFNLVGALGLTLGFSVLSYRYLESPFLLLKSGFNRTKPEPKVAQPVPRPAPAPVLEEASRPLVSSGSPALW